MANAAGMIYESIWRDPDWRELSRGAQALYMQLLSQKEVDTAGVLPLLPDKWAKGCVGLTTEQIMADLDELQERRFVYYDLDTDEACIRGYIRNAPNVMKSPNMRKSARRCAGLVASPRLRAILAAELRATGDPECILAAEEISPTPDLDPATEPAVSKQFSEGFRKGSGRVPEPPSNSYRNSETHLSSTKGGSARPECSKHPDGNSEEANCRGCMKRRLWDEDEAKRSAADELHAKRLTRERAENCPHCHGTNLIDINDNLTRKCHHENLGATTA